MNSSISNSERSENWSVMLEDCISVHTDIEPVWGVSDCLLMVSDCVEVTVGVDPFAKFRGKYSTELGAAKLMKQNKCDNVKEVFEKYLSLEKVNRLQARRGDVGVILINGEYASGVFVSGGFAVKQPNGVGFFPATDVNEAYKIGI